MRRLVPSIFSFLFGLVLALLLLPVAGPVQTATAQTSTSDVEAPVPPLRQATPSSDSQLVDLATALLEARADTKISFQKYQKGVRYFQLNHPQFYGAFFGDPFYASYDIRYEELVQKRLLANLDVNPQNSYWSRTWFLCRPHNYDPAFGGRCWGFSYASSDFFLFPAALQFPIAQTRRSVVPGLTFALYDHREDCERRRVSSDPHRPNEDHPEIPDTSRAPVIGETHPAPFPEEPPSTPGEDERPDHLADRLQLPDDLETSMQETTAALERAEKIRRIRKLMKRKYGDGDLTAREKFEFASELADRFSSEKGGGADPPVGGFSWRDWREDGAGYSPELELPSHERFGGHDVNRTGADAPDLDRPDSGATGDGARTPDENPSSSETSNSNAKPSPDEPRESGGSSNSEDPKGSGGN